LNRLDFAFNRRVTLGGLHVFLHFGFRLFDALLKTPALNEEIPNCQNSNGAREIHENAHRDRPHDGVRAIDRICRKGGQLLPRCSEGLPYDESDNADQEQQFQPLSPGDLPLQA